MLPTAWNLVAASLGALGLVAMVVGLIGKRVSNDPRCAACGYDLSGSIDEVSTCPECGKALDAKNAVVRGKRARRPRLVLLSLLLLAPPSFTGWYFSVAVQPVAARPTWLLLVTLRLGPTLGSESVGQELLARARFGEMNEFGERMLIGWGLSAWTDAKESRGWQHAEVIEFGIARGEIEPDDLTLFFERVLQDAGQRAQPRRQDLAIKIAREIGPNMRPVLEEALDSPDESTRNAAVTLLLDDPRNEPSPELIRIAIEHLGLAQVAQDTRAAAERLPVPPAARRAARYLTHHAPRCAADLVGALESDNAQRRLLASLVLTTDSESMRDASIRKAIGSAVGPSLLVNHVPGDAGLAMRALLRAGPEAVAAAGRLDLDAAAVLRLDEARAAFGAGLLPPHLARLAGPLPWQDADRILLSRTVP